MVARDESSNRHCFMAATALVTSDCTLSLMAPLVALKPARARHPETSFTDAVVLGKSECLEIARTTQAAENSALELQRESAACAP
jgi:hypothetical protein